jgi:hypothetical protein
VSGSQAHGINALGQVVGNYVDARGIHGYLATPVPGPGALLLSAAGALDLFGRVRRRWRKNVSAPTAD